MGVWRPTVSVVLSACLLQLVAGTSCPGGMFGDTCIYSCHCTPPCNQTTGVCNGACDRGWFGGNGQTCQRENVAFNKTASSPPTDHGHKGWTADKAVDGNRDQDVLHGSCYHSNSKAPNDTWTVDLAQPYRIHDVRIYNRAGYPHLIRTAVLTLSNSSSFTHGVTCFIFPNDTAKTINSVYDVTCDGTGRYFTITHSTGLILCEVEIYVCSPGVFGDSCNQFCHCFQATCDPVSGVCPGDCRPGWQGGRCDTVCSNGSYGQNCNNSCMERRCAGDSPCDHIGGTCIPRCEIGWMGDDCRQACSSGSYGQNCRNYCTDRKCAGDSPCDHVRGTCVSGCEPGWMGKDCREACSSGIYGQNCGNYCTDRKCAGDSPCDHVRGKCVSGCEPGWMSEDCREACSNGSYGHNCNNSCTDRKCTGDSPCDHVQGTCVSRCEPGWMGEDCREVCYIGRYGANCDKTCASRQCVGNSSCNSTGDCDNGCETRWTGADCTVCDIGRYGVNCDKTYSSRHCVGDSSCYSTGHCDCGCVTGWTGADCTEDVRSVQAAGYNTSQLAVAVAVAFVAGAVLGVIVSVIVWRRRNRRLDKTSHPTHISNAQTERSQASDDVGPGTRTYDSLNAVSYDAKMEGDTYCTIKSSKTDLGTDATVFTSCDVSDSNGARTYETLDNTSRGTDGEYSEIGKLK
ncbi:multiple epidermal growth factor-like domains protein 10 isoform X1 [Haliotis rufescens]|uniref:multiple epidermal growth factor-like domains protein 10 isoform X1 n=1 Tax=Haliotis rufescens TaxID=6454 RepID=UPI00201FB156|nr:multiple epidermal growth factor-like domains protein 10 isoform X1 [Haliotis rufescens]